MSKIIIGGEDAADRKKIYIPCKNEMINPEKDACMSSSIIFHPLSLSHGRGVFSRDWVFSSSAYGFLIFIVSHT